MVSKYKYRTPIEVYYQTAERVEYLNGNLIWRKSKCRNGLIAGKVHLNGYRYININDRDLAVHRLTWFIHYGCVPDVIDHINGDKLDNRIENLRDVSAQINVQNRRSIFGKSKTGLVGVRKYGDKYRARIKALGKSLELGVYDSAEEASAAYLKAKRSYHIGCTI